MRISVKTKNRNQGVHVNVPKADDAAYIRSLVGSLVATHASFLARDSVQVSHKIKIKIKIK
jgi:hypothetical protein